jgi:branched-chain amino acid transport system substrate-binding protein
MAKNVFTIAAAVLALALTACPPKSEAGSDAQGNGKEILVGEYGSLSGSEGTLGTSAHNGIMMAIDEVNAAGGINGRKIKVITEDDQSKQEEAANAATKLISQDTVVALLGEVASSSSIAAAPIAQANKVPMITPSSTNPEVTRKGNYIFRTCFTDEYQGQGLADYVARQLGVKRVALLTDVKSDYSQGLAQVFERRYTADGGQVVARASYAKGDNDFRSQLTSIKPNNPEVLFVPGYYTDIGQIAQQARDLGITVPLVGGDGWESPKLIEIGGKALEGCYYSNHYFADDPAPAVHEFVNRYKQRFGGKPDSMAALGYDAARVLADAMKRAKKIDGPSIRDAIADTKNFQGVTGTITLGPDRNPIGKKLVIEEIRNGQLTLKATIEAPATTGTTRTQ